MSEYTKARLENELSFLRRKLAAANEGIELHPAIGIPMSETLAQIARVEGEIAATEKAISFCEQGEPVFDPSI